VQNFGVFVLSWVFEEPKYDFDEWLKKILMQALAALASFEDSCAPHI
jgi:hypothetical protein